MGRLFSNSLYSAGVFEEMEHALQELGLDTEMLRREEYDMGLGNGGLGRLAACFLDSLATLDLPAIGYGIHYEFGLFKQEFRNGHQVEQPDAWMNFGTPWEIVRPEYSRDDPNLRPRRKCLRRPRQLRPALGGHEEDRRRALRHPDPRLRHEHGQLPAPVGIATPPRSSISRPSTAAATPRPCARRTSARPISKVLYPNDKTESGKELRLVQQYFFVACSLRDIFRRFRKDNEDWEDFPDKVAIQLNDTHPAVAIVELMRLFHDEHGMTWDKAWALVTRTFAYTNHTLLPEALEKWSVASSRRCCRAICRSSSRSTSASSKQVEAKWPGDVQKKRVLSIIEEGQQQMVRMANLSVVGSHSVNGVAALHTSCSRAISSRSSTQLYPGQVQQQDQRHHAAPLAARLQSAPERPDHLEDRRTAGSAISTSCAGSKPFADDAAVPERLHGGQARQQGRSRPRDQDAHAASR